MLQFIFEFPILILPCLRIPAYSYLLISTKPKVKKYIITLYIDIKDYMGSAFIQLNVTQKAVCISPEGKFCMMTSQARFTAMIIMISKIYLVSIWDSTWFFSSSFVHSHFYFDVPQTFEARNKGKHINHDWEGKQPLGWCGQQKHVSKSIL